MSSAPVHPDPAPPAAWRRHLADALGGAAAGIAGLERTAEEARLTLGFLRGRLEFRPEPTDIYVVTYPRSGTTWVQFLLQQLTSGGDLDFAHLTDVSPWFERALARGTHRAADFARLPAPRVFKSHLTPAWLPGAGRFVYVARAPEDVALSYFHFYRSHLGFQGTLAEFLDRFLRGAVQYGAWADHVGAWRERQRRRDVLWLTYDALKQDPAAAIDRLIGFLELQVAPALREQTLERSHFRFMKQHEPKFDHATAVLRERGVRAGAFLREGRAGAGAESLGPEELARIQRETARLPRRRGLRLDLPAFLH